jgi:hypothetical protein
LEDRASAIQETLLAPEAVARRAETQVSGLNAEYLSMDDPGHRGLLETRLQRATESSSASSRIIEKQTKAAADLQEEARKSNIPAGWVR